MEAEDSILEDPVLPSSHFRMTPRVPALRSSNQMIQFLNDLVYGSVDESGSMDLAINIPFHECNVDIFDYLCK